MWPFGNDNDDRKLDQIEIISYEIRKVVSKCMTNKTKTKKFEAASVPRSKQTYVYFAHLK